MKAGLFGYDMTSVINACGGGNTCNSAFANYDGWSQGAYMKFTYNDSFTDYHNFGGCWQDGNCWGAWL